MLRSLTIVTLVVTALLEETYLHHGRTLRSYSTLFVLLFAVFFPVACLYLIFLAPLLSPLRSLPKAPQGPAHKRFFKEPNSDDLAYWMETVPNDGLLVYYGILNSERVFLTTTENTKIVHDGDTKCFTRPPAAKAVLTRSVDGGIFAAEAGEHTAQRKEMQPAFK